MGEGSLPESLGYLGVGVRDVDLSVVGPLLRDYLRKPWEVG